MRIILILIFSLMIFQDAKHSLIPQHGHTGGDKDESFHRYNRLSPIFLVYSIVCSTFYGFMLGTVDLERCSSPRKNWLPGNIKRIPGSKNIQSSQRLNFCLIRLNTLSTELHKNMIWET